MRRLRLVLLLAAGCAANEDVPAPLVASIVPDRGVPGAVVMISGSYFCQRPDNGQDPTCDAIGVVEFGTVPGTPTTWTDSAIMVEVPHANGDVDVSVTAMGRISNGIAFTVE